MSLNVPGGEQKERDRDTTELSTEEILGLKLGPDDEEITRKLLDKDEESDGFGPNNPGGVSLENIGSYLTTYWYYFVAGAAVLLLVIVLLTRGGGGGAPEEAADPSPSKQPEPVASEPAGPIEDTGIGFAEPVKKDGGYYLRSGEISWKGKIETNDTGQVLTLEGPTAAQFKRAVALPHGEIMTGVFGRAQPDQPVVHGTFHRVSFKDEERTTGTYYAVEDQTVLVEGTYIDERDGDNVVRTYHDDYPEGKKDRSYRVSFEAPPGVPIPTLAGWEPPAVEAQSEAG
jgi:hypothetical protein